MAGSATRALIGALQDRLQTVYDVPVDLSVHDFLTDDEAFCRSVSDDPRRPEEKVLVLDTEDGAAVSVFLAPALLERLEESPPAARLDAGNLADLCLAVEGVSHFLFLAWNAAHDRPVKPVEMELQAEVDKYVIAADLLHQQGTRRPTGLHRALFGHVHFDPGLAPDERQRYVTANRYADRYCRYLARNLSEGGALADRDLSAELARFYRLLRQAKFRHIEDRLH